MSSFSPQVLEKPESIRVDFDFTKRFTVLSLFLSSLVNLFADHLLRRDYIKYNIVLLLLLITYKWIYYPSDYKITSIRKCRIVYISVSRSFLIIDGPEMYYMNYTNSSCFWHDGVVACLLLEWSHENFGRFADYESPGCKADMAEGSAEEEQSSTAAPASPPADLRTLNTQLSPPYHHQPHLQSRLQHLQHSNMLATAVPPRHSHSMLSHQVKAETDMDSPYDVPLNLKSEVSA